MKKLKSTLGIVTIVLITLTAVSCKDAKKENSDKDHTEKTHNDKDGHHDEMKKETVLSSNQKGNSEAVLKDYFNLKDALVADDNAKAKGLGATLATTLGKLDISKYTDTQKADLKDIIEDAVEQAER